MKDPFNNGMICPKCGHDHVYIEHDKFGYSHYCSRCHFTGARAFWNWIAELWFLLGIGMKKDV